MSPERLAGGNVSSTQQWAFTAPRAATVRAGRTCGRDEDLWPRRGHGPTRWVRSIISRRLRVPIATPYRLKIAISFAAVGAVIGEFVAAQEGLGCMILMSTAQAKTPLAFASFIALTIISVVLFYAIELLERRFVTWSQ